jgi:hypothetical protein
MKTNPQTNPLLVKIILVAACFMLAVLCNKSKAAGLPAFSHNSNRVTVNFKHDIEKNELTIRVKSGTEAILQLFIFTPDGILVKEVAVSVHKIATIKGLQKGLYLYECFDNDERMKSGSLIIK